MQTTQSEPRVKQRRDGLSQDLSLEYAKAFTKLGHVPLVREITMFLHAQRVQFWLLYARGENIL